ncbi:MAG: SpoIID/LytB domain-containing protein [Actinomycetota bacterium]
MFRYRLCRLLLLSLVAGATVALPAPAAAQDTSEPTVTFVGGGWGHGVGMSQYGAFGRADAGHTAEEILTYYYDGTTVETRSDTILATVGDPVTADAAAGEGIRVRLGQSRPDSIRVTVDDSRSPVPGGTLTVTIGDQVLPAGTTVRLEQGCQTDADGDCASSSGEPTVETWKWILEIDGGGDSCVDCVAATPVITWPDGTVAGIGELVSSGGTPQYEFGEHDTGALHFTSRDVFFDPDADDGAFVVFHLPLQDYLHALAEMPASWPAEALRAQAIAGRSYAVHRAIDSESLAFDVFDSVQDQVYGGFDAKQPGRITAADTSIDQIVAFDNLIVQTFYSSSNGGHSESTENSSAFGAVQPYHIAKPDPFDSAPDENGDPRNPFARREFEFTVSQLSEWLTEYSSADLDVGTVQQVFVEDLPESGRITTALVTVVGSQRTIEVRGINGVFASPDDDGYDDLPPFGLRFQAAIQRGCEADFGDLNPICPVSSNFEPIGFIDVATTDFFYEPVNWMASEQITTGTAPGVFSPRDPVTRAQAATFVWRFVGEPDPAAPSGFDDVPDNTWYSAAVAWMKEQEITTGTSPTEFSPNGIVTRAQLATFLYRLAGEPEAPPSDQFDDVEAGRFYTDAVSWMVLHEITAGTSPTTFEPEAELTRGQLATFIWRLAGKPEAFADGIELPAKMRS